MGRLIDADALKEQFKDKEGDEFTAFHFYDAIDSAPTIEEPIMCKDCIWWTKEDDYLQERCSLYDIYSTDDWFCPNAERKEGAEK